MEETIVLTYDILAGDFTRTGEASSDMKRKLKQMGVSPDAIRKVATATCEGRINMVTHAKGGVITVEITTEEIKMILADVGLDTSDVKLAMQADYSTASGEIHFLGFGAGIGLLNMKRYSDLMDIDTRIGEGTTIIMVVNL